MHFRISDGKKYIVAQKVVKFFKKNNTVLIKAKL